MAVDAAAAAKAGRPSKMTPSFVDALRRWLEEEPKIAGVTLFMRLQGEGHSRVREEDVVQVAGDREDEVEVRHRQEICRARLLPPDALETLALGTVPVPERVAPCGSVVVA